MKRKFFRTLPAIAAMCIALSGTALADEAEVSAETVAITEEAIAAAEAVSEEYATESQEAAASADTVAASQEEAASDAYISDSQEGAASADTAAASQGEDSSAETGAQLYYVTDEAGLLTEKEDLELEEKAEAVSQEYGIGVYIVTLDDYHNYGSGDVFETTYGIYHEYTMGEGENRDGIMLLLSMQNRDWAMFCYGERCEYAFNEYGQKQLEAVFLDNFGNNDWYGGFNDYIEECRLYMQRAAEGSPVRESPVLPILLVSALVMFITFLIVANAWLRMNNVAKATKANNYIAGSLVLTGQSDTFTYRTETKHKIQSSSSGGGSRSRSGGGGSGRSGKF